MSLPLITLHSASGYRRQLWKNGQGTTTEIAKYSDPDADKSDDFIWRLSIADITQDGPFSVFPGIDRTLMLLDGNGIDLWFNQGKTRHRLQELYSFLSFDGAAEIDCKLIEGATRDFNVMTRRDRARHQIQILKNTSGCPNFTTQGETLLIFCLEGSVNVELWGESHAVARYDTLQIDAPQDTPFQLSCERPATMVLINIIKY